MFHLINFFLSNYWWSAAFVSSKTVYYEFTKDSIKTIPRQNKPNYTEGVLYEINKYFASLCKNSSTEG